MFYGANGHYDYLQSIDEQIAGLQVMGMDPGYYRVTYEGHQHSLDYLHNLARALRRTGIRMICCINVSMCNANGELYANETEAYHAGYQAGHKVAKALVPLGVTIFEMGNELDAKEGIRTPVQEVQGGMTWDFLNSHFPALRGVINGCIAAVRAIGGPTVQIASNAFTACSIACADMLWDGTQPDGTTGHPKLRWDLTNWHNYECYGSMLDMSMDYEKPRTNLLDHLRCKFGVPIIVTEWNGNEGHTDAERAAHTLTFMSELYQWRELFDVRALIVYQLFCGDPWGVLRPDGSVVDTFGATVRDFIAANPA